MDEMDIKSKLLDQLMGEMEDHQASQYQKPVPQMVAVKEETTQVMPKPDVKGREDAAMKKAMGVPPDAEKKTYINPDRQKVMDEIEKQGADASDVPKGWGSFVRVRRG